jgi:hypothetical protein
MKLLFVASDRMEFRHLRRPADDIRTVANGAGAHRAASGIDNALRAFRPEAIVSHRRYRRRPPLWNTKPSLNDAALYSARKRQRPRHQIL